MEDSEYVGKGVSKDFQEKSQEAVHTFLSSHPYPDLNITPDKVKEITLDMAHSMKMIVKKCFPKAVQVTDRFHVQKLVPNYFKSRYPSSIAGIHDAHGI